MEYSLVRYAVKEPLACNGRDLESLSVPGIELVGIVPQSAEHAFLQANMATLTIAVGGP